MPDTTQNGQEKPLQNNVYKESLLKRGNYTVISNELSDAYLSGHISGHCFKLILACLRHSESFHLKDAYLLPKFGDDRRSLRKAQTEAIARGMITITKVREGSSFMNHYLIHDISEWRLGADFTDGKSHTWEIPHMGNPTRGKSHPLNKIKEEKKNKKKKKNDDDGGIEEEGGQKDGQEEASSSLKKVWLSDYEPGALVDALKGMNILWGYVDFGKWNRIVAEVWAGKTQEQIEQEVSHLSRWASDGKRRPPPNAEKLRSLLDKIEMTDL
jgi:hypothetical protein